MTDEYIPDGQGEGAVTPEESGGQASDPVIEYDGQSYTHAEFSEKHRQSVREMNEAQNKLAEQSKWAEPMRGAYNTQPHIKEMWDKWYQGQPVNNQLDPRTRELDDLRAQNLQIQWKLQLQDMRSQGNEIPPEMETKILTEMAQGNVRDPLTAFKALAFDDAVKSAGNEGRKEAANKLASNQAAYKQPPTGGDRTAPAKDMKGKSTSEKMDSYMKDYGGRDFLMD